MATGDLITTAYWRAITGITSDEVSDTLALSLIAAGSAFIKRYTGLDFLPAEYREHVDGTGTPFLWIKKRPIVDVFSVRGSCRVNALQVRYTGAANMATVEVEDNVSLNLRTRAGAAITESVKAFATYPTLTLLAAAVGAVSGWEAAVLSSDARIQESKELLPMQAGDALNALLTLTSADWPIDGYDWEADEGRLIRIDGVWERGIRNFVVRYVAGYGNYLSTDDDAKADALPADLKLLVCDVVTALHNNRTVDGGLKSERLDNYQYERFAGGTDGGGGQYGMSPSIRERLDRWSRWSLT